MVAILQRQIQILRPGKWAELDEIDKKFDKVEGPLGFPSKRRYRSLVGGHTTNTLIIEREWESLAALETAYEKAFASTERQALVDSLDPILESQYMELYQPMP